MASERKMIQDGTFADPFEMARQQDFGFIRQDAQELPTATGKDTIVEWRTVEPRDGGPTVAQAPSGPVTPMGGSRSVAFSWQPNRWRRDRWSPADVIGAQLPLGALLALRAEVQQALAESPEDGYFSEMARAVIEAEARAGVVS